MLHFSRLHLSVANGVMHEMMMSQSQKVVNLMIVHALELTAWIACE